MRCGNDVWWRLLACVLAFSAIPSGAYCESRVAGSDIYTGYYSREENDGKMARASRKSHYIRFYPENRIVRLFIPFPYSSTLSPGVIRQVFDRALNMTTGSTFIQDTFGLLDQRVFVNVDFLKDIDGRFVFDCEKTIPCRIEFVERGMRIVQKGVVTDHVIVYDFVAD